MTKPARYVAVAEALRKGIQEGTYAEGLDLGTAGLAARHATNVATVTKALEVLTGEGVVVRDGDAWKVAEGLFPPDTSAGQNAATPLVVTESAKGLTAGMAAKAEALKGSEVATRETPKVLEGLVVTEHIDPNAERALKREDVARVYQETKILGRTWLDTDTRATKAKRDMSAKLMELRQMFTYKGDPDYNGKSSEYQALAALLYQDLGADKTAQRAILHHVEDRKREMIPPSKWDKFGVDPLSRGQRASLEKKTAKALTGVSDTAKAMAGEAHKGKATGAQLVTLARQIEHGVAVFSVASLRVMTPAQRKAFRDQMKATRDQADAALRELDSLDD
ncbi:hypothetical protein [Streptomyces virginiae]